MKWWLTLIILPILGSGCGCGYVVVQNGLAFHFVPVLEAGAEYWLQVDGNTGGICVIQFPDMVDCDAGLSPLLNEEGAVVGLELVEQTPERASLSIWQDGSLLSTHTLLPDYELTQPGGPHCGDQLRADVVVDPHI